jgi:hypothetical protein
MSKAKGSSAVMAAKRPRLSDGQPWQKLALFCTPPWATRALFEVVLPRLRAGKTRVGPVWDPCNGLGHMSSVSMRYSAHVWTSDIADYGVEIMDAVVDAGDLAAVRSKFGADFRPDWVIVNPPFSPDPPMKTAAQLLPNFLNVAQEGVAMLCRLQWLETEERHRLLSEFPPHLVAIFSERVAMCEGGWDPRCKTATAYAWFIWKRGADDSWLRLLADGQFTTFLIPPGQKQALTRASDAALAQRHVPGFVPPSTLRKQRAREAYDAVQAEFASAVNNTGLKQFAAELASVGRTAPCP